MSETKFTKGPWSVYLGGHDIIEVHCNDGLEVVHWHGFDSNDLGARENKANARLIAAAPEMYHLLEEVASHDECQMLKGQINKLLAKVRGDL